MINAVGNRMVREIARQSRLADELDRTQIQISTGRRIQRASDDPVAARRAARIEQDQSSAAAWRANVDVGATRVRQADGVLRTTSDLLARARELLLSGAGSATSPADRQTIANELTVLADAIDDLAQTSDVNGEALFATGTARQIRFDSTTVFAPVPGVDEVFMVGGSTIATLVRDAAAAVTSNARPQIDASLAALTGAIDHVADRNAQLGLSGSRLERLEDLLAERDIALSAELSEAVDTDLTEAIARLNAQTITLEAAQAAFARINRQTLFDILG